MKTTQRGFKITGFVDRYGVECNIQESSLATEDAIWIGCKDANPQILTPNNGWQKVYIPGLLCNTRMHLTRDQVKDILPFLQNFVETGELE